MVYRKTMMYENVVYAAKGIKDNYYDLPFTVRANP